MLRRLKSPPALAAGIVLGFAALVAIPLWILPEPHRPLHYLLAGTFATAFLLGGILVRETLRRAAVESLQARRQR